MIIVVHDMSLKNIVYVQDYYRVRTRKVWIVYVHNSHRVRTQHEWLS